MSGTMDNPVLTREEKDELKREMNLLKEFLLLRAQTLKDPQLSKIYKEMIFELTPLFKDYLKQ